MMKELGMALLGTFIIAFFFSFKVYPDLEYSGFSSVGDCTGECYAEYVSVNGTPAQIEERKQAAAQQDPFSSVRSLWSGCAACHGAQGQGGIGPQLTNQTTDYLVTALQEYKQGKQRGPQSAMMWGQAAGLSQKDMDTIAELIIKELK
jgi:cytochrome c553